MARKQTAFGNERLRKNGVGEEKGRILCTDFRDLPKEDGRFNKIVSLEMAEVCDQSQDLSIFTPAYRLCPALGVQHVGIRRYSTFLKQVYDLLDDDGIFVFQVAGIRTCWQFEDLNWGLL